MSIFQMFFNGIFIALWAVLCSFGVDTWLFGEKPNATWVEKAYHLQLDGATVDEAWDTHGGFLGDGTTYIVLSLSESIEDQITAQNNEYVGETKTGGPWYSISEYALAYTSLAEEVKDYRVSTVDYPQLLPTIENGYFCLINDFQSKNDYVFFTEDTAQGLYMNWRLAVYDSDTLKLYYYEYDS
jgi:hypothetical protein